MPPGRFRTVLALLAVALAVTTPASAASACPAIARAATVNAGCPCTPEVNATYGACESGFVCAQPWALQKAEAERSARVMLAAAGGGDGLLAARPGDSPAAASGFVCVACAYGQLCPRGASLPPVVNSSIQMALNALACPAGFYCPTPASMLRCPAGYFCPPSTVQPLTCDMQLLISAAPGLRVPDRPATMAQRVFVMGQPLQGNSCPVNSSVPAALCPKGHYCPDPAQQLPCPAGFYCRGGSLRPEPCPFLTACPAGASSADLSYSGLVILCCAMAAMWLAYGALRAALSLGRRRLEAQQEAQERLRRVLHPLLGGGGPGSSRHAFRAFTAVRPRLTLGFEGLGLDLHDGRTILSGVTGRFEHSRVSAVMGPSGAGKTTLLSVLRGTAGASGRQRGRILVNGRPMKLAALRSITGFVPQEDVVHEDLTVRENLAFSARLRLSASKLPRERAALVEDCIDLLQLRHVQHQVVGSVERRGISGGQRKRVSIGMELAAKPSLLLLDEPTSGLDATVAADILSALTRVSRLGATIVAVVHQPRYSIFRAFDDVLLLGPGGRTVFLGPSRLALPYLEMLGFALPPNENPADFAMDVIAGSIPCADGSPFQPVDLFTHWLAHGRTWAQMHAKLGKDEDEQQQQQSQQQAARGVDPQQQQLLEEAWDRQDADGDGALDAAGLLRLLQELGLEPTQRSVAALVSELAVPRTGLVPRHAFLHYVTSGGRAPPPAPPPAGADGTIPASRARRASTLYRVYSIEQYTLAGALSEAAAAALPEGLRSGAMSLKDFATAHHHQEQAAAAAAAASAQPASAQPAAEEDVQAGGSRRVSSVGSPVRTLHLPLPAAGAATAAAAAVAVQQPMLVDVPAPAPAEPRGLAAWLGLGHHELRVTPGVPAQFRLLLARSGIKWVRGWSGKMLEVLLLILAAVVCGIMHGSGGDEWKVRGNTAMIFLTIGVLSGATALSLFGFTARVVWWREQERGVRSASYFGAATAVQLVDVFIQPLVFLAIYYSLTLPAIPFLELYGVGVLVVWYCSSLGTLLSLLAPPSSSLLATVALIMIAGGLLNGVSPNHREMAPALRVLTSLSYNRWAVEAVSVLSFARWPEWRWPATKMVMTHAGYCGLDRTGLTQLDDPSVLAGADAARLLDVDIYCDNYAHSALLVLAAVGTILRLLTALAVRYCSHGIRLEAGAAAAARLLSCGGRRRKQQLERQLEQQQLEAGAVGLVVP